ncbi:hypothetical protein [Shewanella subflava]|uniref:Hemerythrin-like domain-containing protein n=1 Tax=Shewanella subflava TaxID=2986476 RepID=A0ABT3ID02_9GAMM|nr:hypothetical protein [Shewanella subflava]MCW3173922.1 hypothetical protein [Shewanella subflava]
MQGLMTNYFSATHDKQSLLFYYAKSLITKNMTQAQQVFYRVKTDLMFFIRWEEAVLLPLFEDKNSPLFETYPTYSLLLELQHSKILMEHIDQGFLQLIQPLQAPSNKAKLAINSKIDALLEIFDELEDLLLQLNIKKESIFFPTIDEALPKDDIAKLFLTMINFDTSCQ